MSLSGRISIDVLFHDVSGQRLKITSLQDSQEYSSGRVAVVSGTCGTATVTIPLGPTTYRDASGDLVTLSPQRVAFRASGNGAYLTQTNGPLTLLSQLNRVCVSDVDEQENLLVQASAGTCSYSITAWG